MNQYCEDCDGHGYHEYADYDWDENILETGIRIECDTCNGHGYIEDNSIAERIASLLLTKDSDEDICKKIKCSNEEKSLYDCVDCVINFFSKPCIWDQDGVCVNGESEWCTYLIDNVKCGECRQYER